MNARDELAALIRDFILAEQWGDDTEPQEFCDLDAEQISVHRSVSYGALADAILAAGWRGPKPAEYGRWYRTLTPDGKLWAETSDPHDWYLAHSDPTVTLAWERITTDDNWVPWVDHPTDMVHPSTTDVDDDRRS